MYFIYCPVQRYKIMFRRFLFSRIWSSAQDYAVMGLLLNPVVFWISTWQNLSGWNDLNWLAVYQFEKGISAGPALKSFTWFIGAGGSEGTSFRSAKSVQRRTEGQLDHTVFPPENTVSSEPTCRPALLGSAGGGRQAYQGYLQAGIKIVPAPKTQAWWLPEALAWLDAGLSPWWIGLSLLPCKSSLLLCALMKGAIAAFMFW